MTIIVLPNNLNEITLEGVLGKINKFFSNNRNEKIVFDFSRLKWIEPFGIVSFSSVIEFYRDLNASFAFSGHDVLTNANKYLDDAEFFYYLIGRRIFSENDSSVRSTTIPYRRFSNSDYIKYLYSDLAPWIGWQVKLSDDTLETIRACLEEIFHNVEYHSGKGVGFTLSQHFPAKKIIRIAISDCGVGIPVRVAGKLPGLSDAKAIKKACEEGFTTQSNVKNRGVGLALLIKYVVGRNSGRIKIISSRGCLEAFKVGDRIVQNISTINYQYPGTIVHIDLRTDTLESFDEDVQKEAFLW